MPNNNELFNNNDNELFESNDDVVENAAKKVVEEVVEKVVDNITNAYEDAATKTVNDLNNNISNNTKQDVVENDIVAKNKKANSKIGDKITKNKKVESKEVATAENNRKEENKENNKTEKNNLGLRRKIFLICLLLAVAIAVFTRLNHKEEEAKAPIPVVDTMYAGVGNIYSDVSVTGTVIPKDTLAVVCKIADGGEVKKIYVKNGDYVNEGDPICEIDNKKHIDAAFIQYETTKNAYERTKKLYDSGDISKQNFEQVKAQYDAAKLSYDSQVEFATPVATGNGYIENTNMTENLGVDYKAVLCYITSDKGKEIKFGVTERAIDGIKVGDRAIVEKSGKKYNAVITDKASLINSNTGLFDVKAAIEDADDLQQGIMAKVTVIYNESENTMIIPRSIIYYENEKPLVYYLDNENKVRVANLTLGIETDEEVEVLSGVDKNMKIISTWNSDLVNGTEVKEISNSTYNVIEKVGKSIYKNNQKEDAIKEIMIATNTEVRKVKETETETETIKEIIIATDTEIINTIEKENETEIEKETTSDVKEAKKITTISNAKETEEITTTSDTTITKNIATISKVETIKETEKTTEAIIETKEAKETTKIPLENVEEKTETSSISIR